MRSFCSHEFADEVKNKFSPWKLAFKLLNVFRYSAIFIYHQVSSLDTILTAESLNSVDELYGNYSMGPIDAKAEVNGTTRVACLQVKCPTFDRNGNTQLTIVRVAASTAYGNCRIRCVRI